MAWSTEDLPEECTLARSQLQRGEHATKGWKEPNGHNGRTVRTEIVDGEPSRPVALDGKKSKEVIPTWRSLFDSPSVTPRPALAAAPVEAGAEVPQGPAAAPATEAQVPDEEEKDSSDSTSLALLATAARQLESL
ncbi:hypothetical protein PInf_017988 [Phytophthora infestans]|nr:hypothetical protein PInf_017988 [Phytophthora infestans]